MSGYPSGTPPVAARVAATSARWRHKKRGSSYDEIGTARLQVADAGALRDMEEMIVYRSDDGQLWVRSALEFHDGRFELLKDKGSTDMTDNKRETVSDGLKIKFDKPMRERLRTALAKAKREGRDPFTFEDNDYVVRYAEYLLEYLDTKL